MTQNVQPDLSTNPPPEMGTVQGPGHRLWTFARGNLIFLLAFVGLIMGTVVRFGVHLPGPANLIWLAALVLGGAPVVYRTVVGMLHGNFASDVVAMLAIVVAVIMGQSFAGLIIVIMQSGGEALEKYSLRRASSSLEHLLARAPSAAHRKTDTGIEEITVEQVRIGDILLVRPGDLIPVDGDLLSTEAQIDEAALTGEAITAPKRLGAALLSGSINAGDAFELRATHTSIDSKYSQIVALVQKAQQEKPPLQRLADRYAVWFTPVTLLTAGLGWLITGRFETVLAVLVVATPCPLILAVPVAVISGINRAASFGIIVKGGTAIEQIGRAEAMVFDKTGTLTYGSPTVEQAFPYGDLAKDEFLRLAGSAEQLSSHPLAQAMTRAALLTQPEKALPLPLAVREVAGSGVRAQVEGRAVAVGSPTFIGQVMGHPVPAEALQHEDLASYVAVDGSFAGAVTFSDQLRPGVQGLMARLRELGVQRTVMLTGDRAEHASGISAQAGLDSFEAGLLPEGKVEAIRKLEAQYGSVVMVGDGINDAPALATATVGVAMGAHGTGISAEAADIVLLVDDVTRVADAVEVGQRMLRVARQSIFVGLGLSFGMMGFAAFGLIPPVAGALAQEGVDVLVILNALRAR
jgi:heavy metal translocating P-type ATPase